MTDRARIRIAATVTAVFLAGISAAGLAARDQLPRAAATVASPSSQTPATNPASGDEDSDREDHEEFEDDD